MSALSLIGLLPGVLIFSAKSESYAIHTEILLQTYFMYDIARSMTDVINQVHERHAKAKARVERAEKALDSARSELFDIEAALRVLAGIAGGNTANLAKNAPSEAVSVRQANILEILPIQSTEGVEPKALYGKYDFRFPDDNVGLDVFRTTLWRMKERGGIFENGFQFWTVMSEQGRYWKQCHEQVVTPDEQVSNDYDL